MQPIVDHFNDHIGPEAVQGILDNVMHFMTNGEDMTSPKQTRHPEIEIIEIDPDPTKEEIDNATGEILYRTEGTTCYGAPVPGKQIGSVCIDGEVHPVMSNGAKPDSIKIYPHNHIYKRTTN